MSATEDVTFEEISVDESWRVFDETAQRVLHISADEFVRGLDSGEFDDCRDIDVMQVAMLRASSR